MKNLAVIVSVAKYHNLKDLPACSRDGEALATVLGSCGQFSETVLIDGEKEAADVKKDIIAAFRAYKDDSIDQFVFYFTGHGDFDEDEFYFLLKDYEEKKVRQTSLENSELDRLVLSLKPQMYVKIVDACHSGVAYIKNSDIWKGNLRKSITSFGPMRAYFMFSSLSEQNSMQRRR